MISIADLFAVCYLWDVFNEDKCCVVTHRAADILVASLGLFTWVAYVCKYVLLAYCNFESKQAILITLFGRRPNNNITM